MLAANQFGIGDRYHRETQTIPALLTAFPALLTSFAWITALEQIAPAIVVLIGYCGVVGWMAQLARTRGEALEQRMFREREPWPTTILLREKGITGQADKIGQRFLLTPEERSALKGYLKELNPEISFPEADSEPELHGKDDTKKANDQYRRTVRWLREVTRDRAQLALVHEEEITYGFHRNFLALRPIALWVASLSIGLSLLAIAWNWSQAQWRTEDLLPRSIVCFTIGTLVVYAAAVAWFVDASKVKTAGYVYARALLFSVERLVIDHRARQMGKR